MTLVFCHVRDVSFEGLAATMATNAVGPLIIAKSVAPLLQKGNAAFSQQQRLLDKKDYRGVVVNMSARVGSIGENGLGGWYSYRMSKTGENALADFFNFYVAISVCAFPSSKE